MKKNDIKKIIKMDMTSRIPNVMSKIDLNQIEGSQEITYRAKINNHFKLVYVTMSLLIITAAFIVLSSRILNTFNDDNIMFQDDDTVYVFTAFSAATLLQQSSQQVSLSQNTLYFESMRFEMINVINIYLPFVETLIMPNQSVKSHILEERQHIVFSGEDLRKKQINYQTSFFVDDMSIGEIRLNNQDFVIKKNSSEQLRQKDVFVVSQNDFNESNYVVVEHQTTRKEQVFKYSLYISNVLIYESEIRFEKIDHGAIAISIKHQSQDQIINFRITKRSSSFINVLDISYITNDEPKISKSLSVRVIFDMEIKVHMYLYQFIDSDGQKLVEKIRLLSN